MARWRREVLRVLGAGRRMGCVGMIGAGVERRSARRRSCEARRAVGLMGSLFMMQPSHAGTRLSRHLGQKGWMTLVLDITAKMCASRKKKF